MPGSVDPFVDCSGAGNGDTVVEIFTDRASALAYAHRMLAEGKSLGLPTAEVVGPNWTVNTAPAFAKKVIQAVNGQLLTSSAAGSSS